MSDAPPIARITWKQVMGLALFETALAALIFAGVCWVFGLYLFAAGGAPAAPSDAAVRTVLATQVEAWNRGDLDAFMTTYWNSDELTFFSDDAVTKGWRATFDRYRRRYQAEGKEMGRLEFADLRVDVTGDDWAAARARWKLTFKDGKTTGGLFTLLLRRVNGDWRIVHDHTSAGKE
jgi:beta-aspartyl-peptidase (threonine type)